MDHNLIVRLLCYGPFFYIFHVIIVKRFASLIFFFVCLFCCAFCYVHSEYCNTQIKNWTLLGVFYCHLNQERTTNCFVFIVFFLLCIYGLPCHACLTCLRLRYHKCIYSLLFLIFCRKAAIFYNLNKRA